MFGTSIQSYMMGDFIEILIKVKEIEAEVEDGDNLTRFFYVLKRFNGGKNINIKFKEKMEKYFEYRWKNHKN